MNNLQLINMHKAVTVHPHHQLAMLRTVIRRVVTDKYRHRQTTLRIVLNMITVNIHRTIGELT